MSSAFASLDGVNFRINPSSIDWGFQIDTNVEETIGGRVVQVIGATLSDITLSGEYGEKKGYATDAHHRSRELRPHAGNPLLSWELAEAFLNRVSQMMDNQSAKANKQGALLQVLDFKFPEFGWHFGIYIKTIDDGQSDAAINHTVGNIAYKYRITLQIVEDRSDDVVVASGKGTSLLNQKKAAAINGYISRISKNVGWRLSAFNDPDAVTDVTTGTTKRNVVSGTGQ